MLAGSFEDRYFDFLYLTEEEVEESEIENFHFLPMITEVKYRGAEGQELVFSKAVEKSRTHHNYFSFHSHFGVIARGREVAQ